MLFQWDGGQLIKQWPILALKQGEVFDLERVFWWQWSHWYRFLSRDEVKDEFVEFKELMQEWLPECTLHDANCAASRFLYGVATQKCGWKKLRADQLAKLGFHANAGCWQREQVVTEAYRIFYAADGCGQATHEAATAGSWNDGSREAEWEALEMEFYK